MVEFDHPTVATKDVHRVQQAVYVMPVSTDPRLSIQDIADSASVGYGLAKKTLGAMDCVGTKRTGGPRLFRREPEPKTVNKKFDATKKPAYEGTVPVDCTQCPFSNSVQQTQVRNRPTSGCVILGIRKANLGR